MAGVDMAKPNQVSTGANAVLPLAPLEYDVQWANNMVRILNFTQQQMQNPGSSRCSELTVTDRDNDTQFIVNPQELTETLTMLAKNLPASSTNLVDQQIWHDGELVKITPAGAPASELHVTTLYAVTGNITTVNSTTGNITTINSTTGNITTVNATTGTITTINSTTGNITTVNADTGNIDTLNSDTGTITTLNSTTGNITTLNTTTGTITTLGSTTANISTGNITTLNTTTGTITTLGSTTANIGTGNITTVNSTTTNATYLNGVATVSDYLRLNSIPTSPSGPSGTVWRDGSGYLRIV